MNLNELKARAYKTAKAHGWHDEEHSDETYLMLIITEIAEAVQADRAGKHAFRDKFEASLKPDDDGEMFSMLYNQYIKNTVEDELADVVIRCLSFAGHRHWNLKHVLDDVKDASNIAVVIGDETFAETAFYTCKELFDFHSDYSAKEAVCSVLINIVEYCNYKGINLWWHIEQKMRYNELRPYKHGGKRY